MKTYMKSKFQCLYLLDLSYTIHLISSGVTFGAYHGRLELGLQSLKYLLWGLDPWLLV